MSKIPLSNVDLAWLRMDNPKNLMVITALITLTEPLGCQSLMQIADGVLLKFDRFRQRIVLPHSPLQRPYWEEDPYLNLDYHVKTAHLLPPGGKPELEDFV